MMTKTLLFLSVFSASVPTTALSQNYLSQLERDIVAEHNLARSNPRAYAKYLEEWIQYFDDQNLLRLPGEIALRTNEGVSAVEGAVAFLRSARSMHDLAASRGLSLGARDHVADLGPRGDMAHSGSDGSQPHERMNRRGTWLTLMGENIAFGSYDSDDGRAIVMALLIDDGVPSRGHRSNIFNPAFAVVGVSCGFHDGYGTMCVMDYAAGYEERGKD